MAVKERTVVLVGKDSDGNITIDMPVTTVDNVEGAILTVNGQSPDSNGDVKVETSNALAAYPVGSIYMSVNSTNPSQLFGGTWVALNEGRVLIGAGTAYPAGTTGGEATHTLTTSEMPSHSHSGSSGSDGSHSHSFTYYPSIYYQTDGNYLNGRTMKDSSKTLTQSTTSKGSHSHSVSIGSTGGGSAHNNMQPYLSVYMWKRTA